jgi:chemotaxis protein CheD
MPDQDDPLPEIYVQPGESHLVKEPSIMRTLLGSCVGVVFWAPRLNLGALAHPMLPNIPTQRHLNLTLAASRRYVDFAIRDLIRQFDALGARRGEVLVKLFGGGDVLLMNSDAARPTVGKLNCESALRVLSVEGLDVVASSLGGRTGVNIQFHTGTGEVLLKRHR